MLKKRCYSILAVILIMCLTLSGCSDKGDVLEETENTKAIVLEMSIPSTFNPVMVENKSIRDALSLCYEPLFELDEKMQPVGVLAESAVVSDDCMSAIVKLKDSILWHDGIKATSADVVHTVNYIKSNPSSPYYGCVKNIEEVVSIDPLSMKIVLAKPYAQIVQSLYFPIIAAHTDNVEEKILGTGPYVFDSYAEAVALNLRKNDKWHGGDALCANVVVKVVRDNEAAVSAFNTGSINTVTSNSFDLENSTPKLNSKLTQYPSLQYEFMMFNHNRSRLSSPTVRAAISGAIDRNEIAKDSYSDAALPANTPIHPASAVMAESSVGSQYNLSAASETLFLEGYSMNEATGLLQNERGEKLSFGLLVNKDNQSRVKAAYKLASQLFLAGIEVNITELPFEKYLSEIKSGNYDAYIGGVTLSNLYDYEFFFTVQSGLIPAEYVSEPLTAAMQAIAMSPSDGAMSTALVSFDEVFQREQPFCGLVFKNDTLLTSDAVTGKIAPCPGFPYTNIAEWNIR